MALNLSDITNKRREIQAEQARGNDWRPGKGSNRFRFATWDSKITGKTEFFREIWIHQAGKGAPVFVCNASKARTGEKRNACPHCEQYEAVRKAESREKAQPFKSKKRFVFLGVPTEKMDQPFKSRKVFPFVAAQLVGDAVLAIVAACDEVADVNDYFGPNGLDMKITFDPDAPPASMYSVKVLPKNPAKGMSEPMDPALFKDISKMDPYADDLREPAWFLEAQGIPVTAIVEDDAVAEASASPAPINRAAAPANPQGGAVVTPGNQAPVGKFLTPEKAKALIDARPDLKGWTVGVDPDGDAYFISPTRETQYGIPAPIAVTPPAAPTPPAPPAKVTLSGNFETPEAQMAARGMKPAETIKQPPPDDSKDAAGDE